jgi:hypothetical protein
MRGRRPIPIAIHLARGTFRRDRHGDRIDAPKPGDARTTPSKIGEAEQATRKAEFDALRPPDPGPRPGGKVKRIRW